MNSKSVFPSQAHFHIRWSAGSALDWEAFGTRVEAEATARRLARTHESPRIEERNGACKRCLTFSQEKTRARRPIFLTFSPTQQRTNTHRVDTRHLNLVQLEPL